MKTNAPVPNTPQEAGQMVQNAAMSTWTMMLARLGYASPMDSTRLWKHGTAAWAEGEYPFLVSVENQSRGGCGDCWVREW